MAEYKERSGLFKFFYIILRVITFPLYAALYILRHPLLVLAIVGVAAGVAVYLPLSEGKTLADAPEWYKNKYVQMRMKAVKNLADSEKAGFLSQEFRNELKQEAEEANRHKGENYNQKVSREDKIEEKTAALKKRGGFKRRNSKSAAEDTEGVNKEDILNQSSGAVGGLASVLKDYKKQDEDVVNQAPVSKTGGTLVPDELVIEESILPASAKAVSAQEANKTGTKPQPSQKNDADLDEFDLF